MTDSGVLDITQLVTSVTWSGDRSQAARRLDVRIASSASDVYLPKAGIETGGKLIFSYDSKELFRGYIFTRELVNNSGEMSISAYDGAIYLAKNDSAYNFSNTTAEEMAAKICMDYAMDTGYLAKTGIRQSKICIGDPLYDIIMKAYTAASRINGKKYMILMLNGKINVIEKGAFIGDFEISQDTNLLSASYSESIEDMVNKVAIVDDTGNIVGYVKNDGWMKKYGQIQKVYKQETDKNAITAATSMLHGMDRTASVEVLGDFRAITGYAVAIRDSYTGLAGKFYIDTDTHTFQNYTHTMSLSLTFENMMDEKEYTEQKKSDKSSESVIITQW